MKFAFRYPALAAIVLLIVAAIAFAFSYRIPLFNYKMNIQPDDD